MKKIYLSFAIAISFILIVTRASAEVYYFLDKNGVKYFTQDPLPGNKYYTIDGKEADLQDTPPPKDVQGKNTYEITSSTRFNQAPHDKITMLTSESIERWECSKKVGPAKRAM